MEDQAISRAEFMARRKGYSGVWPPRPEAPPKSKSEFDEKVAKLESGDHRTSLMAGFGRWTQAFYHEITPSEMKRMARLLIKAIGNEEDSTKSRTSAIESTIKLATDLSKVVPELSRVRKTDLQRHIERLLEAFMETIGEDGFKMMARELLRATKSTVSRNATYAIGRLHRLMVKTLEMSMAIEKANPTEPAAEIRADDPRIIKADEEFLKMGRAKRA